MSDRFCLPISVRRFLSVSSCLTDFVLPALAHALRTEEQAHDDRDHNEDGADGDDRRDAGLGGVDRRNLDGVEIRRGILSEGGSSGGEDGAHKGEATQVHEIISW